MSQFWFKFDIQAISQRKALLAAVLPITVFASGLAFGQSGTKSVQLPLPVPQVIQRSQWVSHKNPTDIIHVGISMAPSDSKALQAFVDSVNDPKSPNYRQWATPAQLGQKFGQPKSVVDSVVNFFKANGFNVTLVGDSRLTILADATVAQAEAAFQTTLNNYHALNANEPGRTDFYSFSEPINVPASVAPAVVAVTGLDNIAKPRPRLSKHVTLSKSKKLNTVPLTPTQTRTLYNTAPLYSAGLQGQGMKLGISSFDGFKLSNVPLYYKQFNLPKPTNGVGSNITVVTVDGGSGSGTPAGEADLDIQMALGMAPLSTFTIYDGAGNLNDVLTKEQNDNSCNVLSESYGWFLGSSQANACHNTHLLMSAQGITYCLASGDYGTSLEPYAYGDYDTEVLNVGGTIATTDNSGNRTSEIGWSGSAGGWVTESVPFNVLPSFQKGKGVPTNINFRLIPDVALNAAGDAGAYQFFLNGALTYGYDGTSFACPVFAGCLTLTEQKIGTFGVKSTRLGRIADAIYKQNGRPDVWYDITSGSNGTLPNGTLSQATPYWDFVTGWGAANFARLAQTISVTPQQTFQVNSIVVFNNTSLKPNVIEGVNPIGGGSSVPFSLTAVKEAAVGKVATMQGSFNLQSQNSALTYDPTKIASLSLSLQGSAAAQATVTVYLQNQVTGKYDSVSSVSGTSITGGTTISVNPNTLTNYVSSTGQVSALIRYLVPNSRLSQVNNFTFSVNTLTAAATFSLD